MKMRRGLGLGYTLAFVSAVAAAAAPGGGVRSQAMPAASRIIDRAFLCTNAVSERAVREINLGATTGFQDSGGWKWLAEASIGNTGRTPTKLGPNERGLRHTVHTHWGFNLTAGSGPPARDAAPYLVERRFGIWSKWERACEPASKRRVPLSARGLSGGAADYFGDDFDCPAPRLVFVRLRGVFRTPASLRLDRESLNLTTDAPVLGASFAVRTESGKPLAFASVNDSGKARIFTARSCRWH